MSLVRVSESIDVYSEKTRNCEQLDFSMRLNNTSVLTTTPEYVEIEAATPLGISIVDRINGIRFSLMMVCNTMILGRLGFCVVTWCLHSDLSRYV